MGNEQVNVFGDALVGVVGVTRLELHPIIGAIGQPSAEVSLGKPAPPADLEHLVEVELIDGEEDIQTDQPRDAEELMEKGGLVFTLQGAEEVRYSNN